MDKPVETVVGTLVKQSAASAEGSRNTPARTWNTIAQNKSSLAAYAISYNHFDDKLKEVKILKYCTNPIDDSMATKVFTYVCTSIYVDSKSNINLMISDCGNIVFLRYWLLAMALFDLI